MSFLLKIDQITVATLRIFAIVCFAALLLILTGNVLSRLLGLFSMSWFDEIVELLFAWLVFTGSALLWRNHDHFRVDWLDKTIMQSKFRTFFNAALILLSLSFVILMTWHGYQLAVRSQALTPIIQLPVSVLYASIPVGGAVMTAYSLRDLWKCLRHPRSGTFNPNTVEES